jgi:prevent-host-death family protein
MKMMSAKSAKNEFGLLLDTARAEPVTIQKHGRSVAVILSVEEYDRLRNKRAGNVARARRKSTRDGK